VAPQIIKDPTDYTAASNFIVELHHGTNGLLPLVYLQIGPCLHELTRFNGIDHARTLAVVAFLVIIRYNLIARREKIRLPSSQYAERNGILPRTFGGKS